MESMPITQEIFTAFMKCLNQYDFNANNNLQEKEVKECEVDELEMTSSSYLSDMEQLRMI